MEVVAEAEGELTVGPVDEAFVVLEDEIYIFQGIAGEKPVHRRIILRMRTRLPAKET